MRNNYLIFNNKRNHKSRQGSAIIETAVGMFVLVPVFLILLDLIALIVGQTINDDIAKNAARYGAQASTAPAAQKLVNDYMSGITYTGTSGLVCNARIVGNINWTTTQTQVITEVTINLPIAVPFGGPKSQIMQSQSTYPTVGASPGSTTTSTS